AALMAALFEATLESLFATFDDSGFTTFDDSGFAAFDDSGFATFDDPGFATFDDPGFAAFDDPVSVPGFATLLEGSCFESLAPGFERCGIVEGRGLEQLLGREATGRIGQGSNGLEAAKRSQPFLARKAHADRHFAHTLAQ